MRMAMNWILAIILMIPVSSSSSHFFFQRQQTLVSACWRTWFRTESRGNLCQFASICWRLCEINLFCYSWTMKLAPKNWNFQKITAVKLAMLNIRRLFTLPSIVCSKWGQNNITKFFNDFQAVFAWEISMQSKPKKICSSSMIHVLEILNFF